MSALLVIKAHNVLILIQAIPINRVQINNHLAIVTKKAEQKQPHAN